MDQLLVLARWAFWIFVANELVANALSWFNSRRLVGGWAVHGWLALPAIAVVLAPLVADIGSGTTVAAWPMPVRSAVSVLCTMLSQAALWAQAFLLTGLLLDGMRGGVPDRNMVVGNCKSGMLKGAVYSGILMGLLQITGMLVAMPALQSAYQYAPTAGLSSMPYVPREGLALLKTLYLKHGRWIWKDYGFTDAFNLSEDWVAPGLLGIDVGPIAPMIENARTRFCWDTFMRAPEIQSVRSLLAEEPQ